MDVKSISFFLALFASLSTAQGGESYSRRLVSQIGRPRISGDFQAVGPLGGRIQGNIRGNGGGIIGAIARGISGRLDRQFDVDLPVLGVRAGRTSSLRGNWNNGFEGSLSHRVDRHLDSGFRDSFRSGFGRNCQTLALDPRCLVTYTGSSRPCLYTFAPREGRCVKFYLNDACEHPRYNIFRSRVQCEQTCGMGVGPTIIRSTIY